jgi:hypothetical protein
MAGQNTAGGISWLTAQTVHALMEPDGGNVQD